MEGEEQMSDFETWWQQEGQEFLYALNTTTDDDIKLVAEFAWKNGAYKAEQLVSQEPVAVVEITYGREPECYVTGNVDDLPDGVFKLYTAPQPVNQEPVALAWEEGYRQGIEDERTSEANIGICGFNAKVEPNRQNPYSTAPQPDMNLNCKSVQKRLATSWGYVLPVKEVELTDDEIQKWIDALPYDPQDLNLRRFARAVIAAHKEKNRGS